MKTLALTQPDTASGGWDLFAGQDRNIAVLDGADAVAQDVASACKVFLGELYYDQSQGVPYFQQVLGQPVNAQLLQGFLEQAALTVPTVVSARATVESIVGRQVHGTVEVIDQTGAASLAHF